MRKAGWLLLGLIALAAPAGAQPQVLAAILQQPTTRVDQGVLGEGQQWGALTIVSRDCATCAARTQSHVLPENRVFEDVKARIVDLDGDGVREVLVVESDAEQGSVLAVYGPRGRRAATAPVGTAGRWLAPAGVGDFDDDGTLEIAYVDSPHKRRELVFVRFDGASLTEIDRVPGLTNHRPGDRQIWGGVRNCGRGDELLLADPAWRRVMSVRLGDGKAKKVRALRCPDDLVRPFACPAG